MTTLAAQLTASNFATRNGVLLVGGISVSDLAARFGTPLYVYDLGLLSRSYRQLSAALEGFAEVYFSIKANPNPDVVSHFVKLGAGLEVASGAEFRVAVAAGCDPSRILFAGPGKGAQELQLAIAGGLGELHLESFEEIDLCAAIARQIGCKVNVAIRVNPKAEAQGGAMRMGGKPAAFGFDEEILDSVLAAVARHPDQLVLSGVHLFAGTQILDSGVLLHQWRYALQLAIRMAAQLGHPLKTIDLGGGLGIPYHGNDRPLDLQQVAAGVPALIELVRNEPAIRNARVLVEPGRFLAGPAGVYLMAVRAVKESRGARFIITDGGMHHHLAASGNLGQVIKRDYPIVPATRMEDDLLAPASIVGPLCTPLDTLGRQTPMPQALTQGDLIAVLQSGAYGLTASPTGFLSHPRPVEILVEDGQVLSPGTVQNPVNDGVPGASADLR